MPLPAHTLKAHAAALGFPRVGLTPAVPSPHLAAYRRWIEAGMHGSMAYLARPDRVERRRDLQVILPGAQTLVIVAVDYAGDLFPESILTDPARGRIASYAWGLDYHDGLTARLEHLADWLRTQDGAARVYVDTGPLLERSHAQQAGLGFVGKNTLLIHPRRGSRFFIGEILTTLAADEYDAPAPETMCGRCTRCLTACPTDAFPQPHILDSRRCISYWTIEHKTAIEPDIRSQMGNWVFGCDICQDVCPFQRFAPGAALAEWLPAALDRAALPLLDLLALDEADFHARYWGSPVYRIKRERLVRNACVAAGNWGSPEAAPALERLLRDSSDLVRTHAAWALTQLN